MTVRPTTAPFVLMENLEKRQLLADVFVTAHGATPNNGTDDGPAIQRAINASRPGDRVVFPAGTFNLRNTLTLLGDRTYEGLSGNSIEFTIGARMYGMTVLGNAANVKVLGLKLVGGGISMVQGRSYNNVQILNNDISYLPIATRGVYAPVANTGLIVENNLFHDYNEWGVMIYNMDRGSFSNNRFHNITQGAHIVNPYDSVRVVGNGGCRLSRMGIEIQQFTGDGRPCNDLLVEGNVFTSFRRPFFDTFGLSIMPQNSYNTIIRNNYVMAVAPSDGWGIPDNAGVHRFGYGIEAGFRTGAVENNIVSGIWANHVVVSMPNTVVRNNKFFGRPLWGRYVTGEPGLNNQHGSAIEIGNTIDPNVANTPAHGMANVCSGLPPGGPPTPIPTPPPTPTPNPSGLNAPSNLVAVAVSSSRVNLTWKDNSINELGFKIERSFTSATEGFSQIALIGPNTGQWSNYGLPANRNIWYRIRAYGSRGNSEYSNVVQVKTPPLGGGTTSGGVGASAIVSGPTTEQNTIFSQISI